MNDTTASSGVSPDKDVPPVEQLKFVMLPMDRLSLPGELFDSRTPFSRESLSLFIPITVWWCNDSFYIIDGCKRYQALLALNRKECACGIIDAGFERQMAGLMRIGLNRGRPLHVYEKIEFIRWLKTNLDGDNYRAQADRLRISPQERHELERLLACQAPLVEAVADGYLDPTVAPEMAHLVEEEMQVFLNLFKTFSFSRQMQRELVEWLHELAFMEKKNLSLLLSGEPFGKIIIERRLNAPQKAQKIHSAAYELRFPLFTKTKKSWQELARAINPDPGKVTITPPPFFENNGLEIRIKVKEPEEAAMIMRHLAGIDVKTWRCLIDPAGTLSP